MLGGVAMGEPARHREPAKPHGVSEALIAYFSPLAEFLKRQGALVVLLFVLIHKIGDTLANLTLRLLFKDLGFTNDEVAFYDIGVGFVALLVGIFVGGILYARLGMKRSVLISLVLMAVSNLSFAALAAAGHTNLGMAAAIGFENFASGIGGVTVVAYLSALCNLRFTATQYALLSALASIAGRFVTGTSAGALISGIGYVNFYLLTTLVALPGVALFWFMIRSGLADLSIGSAGKDTQPFPPFFFSPLPACFPRAVRVFFGRWAMVLLRRAAAAALRMFLRAAAFCLAVAMRPPMPQVEQLSFPHAAAAAGR